MQVMAKIKELLNKGINSVTDNTLILVEHKPVYTIGIRSKPYEDPLLERRLRTLGADFVHTNRGGLITFHGLGQLVAYPILYLPSFDLNNSIKCYVRRLESTIIDLCKEFGVKSSTMDGLPGVWVANDRKIAAIGIHCSQYVTCHGIAINCNVDLKWFQEIIPCGITDKTVTSLSNELKRDVNINEVMPKLLKSFQTNFNCNFQ
ncbi:putative lipoyltransferase 2, mitochondrial isoform X2 [Oppia nitens]|nr:putative lipoyltransferase 2, mitochondrial isoform X2 [Oppia nitens]